MLNLNDREWKAFNLIDGNMFYIDEVKTFKSTALVENDGVFDIVGATSKNNGNVGFLPKQYANYLIKGNCICLIKTGQGSVGDAVYKQGAFIPSNNVCVIRSSWLNRYNGLFIVAEINKQADRYSYGYIRNNSRIRKEQLMLPTTDDGSPDYAFMEQYIREREDKLKQKYINIVNEELVTPPIPLAEKTWGEFFISDICYIESGRDIYDNERFYGNIPYITSTATNNGIKYYVSNTNETLEENAISVNRNGSVGYSFYHKYKALYSNDCRKLKLKQCRNEFVALFITNQIIQQKDKYNYGYKMGTGRLKKQMIMLPITDEGSPDYEYMEQYVKNVIFRKYKKYLEYLGQ